MSTTSSTMGLVCPDVNDTVTQTVADLAANFAILDALYPVGTIYMSTKNTNPSAFIGGTWTALTGRVLIGAGTDYPAGTTGGEAMHVITVEEMPAHAHTAATTACNVVDGSGFTAYSTNGSPYVSTTGATGGGQAHNNMPPFRAVYMWERTV